MISYSDFKVKKATIIKTQEIMPSPTRAVYKVEREYMTEIKINHEVYWIGFVIIDVDLDGGKTYMETFELSDEQMNLWETPFGYELLPNKMPDDVMTEYLYLVEMMLKRNKTNAIMEICTPKKRRGSECTNYKVMKEYRNS